ncbi:MAG: hypothetical protein ABI760_01695 [Ferruginibacter sp.]
MTKGLFLKRIIAIFIFLFLNLGITVCAQTRYVDKKKFFTDGQLIEITLVADLKKIINEKLKKDYQHSFQPASITCRFPDSTKVTEAVEIRPRGQYRREECYMPPIIINFKTSQAGTLKKLGHLKLVWPCVNSEYDEQLVLKEYLVYKIYNLLTERSFRVRLVKMECHDIKERIKPRTMYAFFIEDVDDLAKRNNCVEVQSVRLNTESTDRKQTTMVTLFEYMIGNTDWAIPIYRNIKLMRSKENSLSRPFVVPYDFDFSGLVNANYAIPPSELIITSVRQRFYLGFPRTLEELQAELRNFRSQKPAIDSLIMNLGQLSAFNKKDMIKYLDEFFKISEREKDIRDIFIYNARKE